MKKPALVIIIFFLIAFASFYSLTESRTTTMAFINVNVIPMTEEGLVLENQTVILSGPQISAIRPTKESDFEEGHFDRVVDGTDKYLMPGLAEMHGHVPPTHPSPDMPDYFNDEYVESTLFLYVAAGVTTVRGMLGYENQLELKDKVGADGNRELVGPKLFLAGPSFNGNSISSPEESAEKVRQQKEEGWDLLKVHPGLTRAEYDAMAETANEVGIAFGGHVPEEVGIEHAIEMGQETVDHIDGYYQYLMNFEENEREAKMKDIVAKTKEAGVWIVPTQALWETIIGAADYDAMKQYDELKYIPKNVRQNYNDFVSNNVENNPELDKEEAQVQAEWRMRILREMNEQGVRILMGTDAPQLFSVPGFSIHRELSKMEEAGMTAYEILESGTANVADYLEEFTSCGLGTIELQKCTDLILVDANPLENLDNLKKLSGVHVNGRWYPKEEIDERLKEIEEYYAEDD